MKNRNFWPLGIAIFFGCMCCMIILTVYISMKYKPDDDNAYFSTRQVVDKDINSILIAQNDLESKYKFYALNESESIPLLRKANRKSPPLMLPNEAILRFKVVDSNNADITPQNARIYITRFADSSADKDIGTLNISNGILTSPKVSLNQGEWKILIEFTLEDKQAYFEQRAIVESPQISLNQSKAQI